MRGVVHKWFQSYLNSRKQFVSSDGFISQLMTIKCDVTQGSILGPLLFILYVNDICNVSNRLNLILYTDDTSVFMSNTDIEVLQQIFTSELQKLAHWLEVNKLVLNINKTNYVIFSNKFWFCFYIDIQIKRVTHVKFLGVTINEKLSWNQYTGVVCNKLSKSIGII